MTEGSELTGDEWTLASFTAAIHRGGVGLWAWSPSRQLAQLDGLCREFWGTSETVVSAETLFAKVHAEDRHRMILDWEASATDPHPYDFEFRIGDEPDARWISARGVGGEAGRVGEWVQAIFLDITERKRAEDAERLVTAELAHRISNMFTVARALTAIVARDAKSTPLFAEDLSRRFGVLHEATTLATRSLKTDQGIVKLQDLAQRILSPYVTGTNITVSIADGVRVPAEHINDYAMIFHELATNSAKYGALSGNGTLTLDGRIEDEALSIAWNEEIARAEPAKSDGTGFGSRLLTQTIERSLQGRFTRTIDARGVRVEIVVPAL
ncbi:histidine kinase [Methylobacterium sp. BTF04]|uniref:HWE histidine kinase domain-containing protein n=1 Tax=Methylobacterium sp. BTF04 TaxID=2708300 RepID=UPI0013D73E2C|nr:HWE histidine kinase domain-containing protein [Methylobacterium sp. BTF04]NEU12779.1 histidine kinase [Methylobacterium sp. BTF04]